MQMGDASANMVASQKDSDNGRYGWDRITVTVGPVEQVCDFGKSTVTIHRRLD